ncbi:MAG TPA: tetratricopeptide repeat protein, partial [Pseudobdellovibrionaceae bacterium]|nr:tetratricopeptide repeat protein [Pseudobdellovibrionaceae bacterium]
MTAILGLTSFPAEAQRKRTQNARKKSVAELLAQAQEESRGGKVRLQKSEIVLPQSQLSFKGGTPRNLNDVKPPRSSELMRSEMDADRRQYNKILDQQIDELFKLSQKFRNSPNRGEMWLRLAELYVEKATILDGIAQDEYDKQLKLFQAGKIKKKPVLSQKDARAYNRRAIQLYEWFERDFPRDEKIDQAYFFLGFNHFEIGNVKKGVDYYERLTRHFPRSPFIKEAYFALGEYYFENEKWSQAYREYSVLLKDKRHRLHTFAMYKGAWCLYRLGKYREALTYLETIIKSGRQETGESLAGRRTVNRSKLEAEASRDLVLFYASVGSAEGAEGYFRNMVGGDVGPYLEKLAYYYSDKGNRDSAEVVFKKLIEANPNHPKAFEYQYQIVQNYFYAKNSPKFREELYRWVKDYGPQSAWANANRGNAELIGNSMKLRETTLRNWVLQQHQTAQNSRAPYSQGLANEGYQLYMREFPESASLGEMHFYYGELLYDMNKYDEAAAQYQWVVEHAPTSKFADKAATNLILAVEKGIPNEKELAKRVGDSVDPIPLDPKAERFIKAGTWYTNRFPKSEKVPEIRFRIGRLYYQFNQFDPASAEFKDIIQKYPKTKYAEYSANLLLDIYNLKKDYVGLEKTGAELLAVPSIASSKAGADIRGVLEKASFKKAQDLEGTKNYAESAVQFEAFAAQNPASSLAGMAAFNAGVNYERAGRNDKAQAAYQKVLASKDPEAEKLKPRTRRLLAKLAQDSYQLDEAATLYRQNALEAPKDPLAPNMMFNAALLYQALGRNGEAVKSYEDFIRMSKKHRDNMEAVFAIAKLHDRAGQKPAAIRRYKEYVESGPSNVANVMEAHGRLFELSAERRSSETEEWRNKTLGVARRLSARGEKYDASWPAKAKMSECEVIFAELKGVRFPNDVNKLKPTLVKKVDILNRLVRNTGEVVKYNSAE